MGISVAQAFIMKMEFLPMEKHRRFELSERFTGQVIFNSMKGWFEKLFRKIYK